MIDHTPGKLEICSKYPLAIKSSKGGNYVANTEGFGDDVLGEANARRIVACWNACDGISTEILDDQGIAGYVASQAFITQMNSSNGLNIELEGGACRVLAESFAGQFKGSGAVNYLEVGFDHKDTGPVIVTMQRVNGKTPAQLKHEAEVQSDELLKLLRDADDDFDREGFDPSGPYRAPIRAAISKATGGQS